MLGLGFVGACTMALSLTVYVFVCVRSGYELTLLTLSRFSWSLVSLLALGSCCEPFNFYADTRKMLKKIHI